MVKVCVYGCSTRNSGAAGILANAFQGLVVHRERMLKAAGLGFLNAVDMDHLARARNVLSVKLIN